MIHMRTAGLPGAVALSIIGMARGEPAGFDLIQALRGATLKGDRTEASLLAEPRLDFTRRKRSRGARSTGLRLVKRLLASIPEQGGIERNRRLMTPYGGHGSSSSIRAAYDSESALARGRRKCVGRSFAD